MTFQCDHIAPGLIISITDRFLKEAQMATPTTFDGCKSKECKYCAMGAFLLCACTIGHHVDFCAVTPKPTLVCNVTQANMPDDHHQDRKDKGPQRLRSMEVVASASVSSSFADGTIFWITPGWPPERT